ncbi:hypothetical protein DICPUDRAFT_98175 [Dictyostelium purpureum]|uniref:Protein transport protein sec16 n=1 Tax=Dictyostelium purpureum TaxID=5786 RepID=F0ZNB0_DICPU|nr:uncharacterized protein DICPUDRAFT_98175 [Dictyostelium purpureum]EGC34575.1 hypothetical protein DICPUDRAFT_98175 [Dictyostelium purpureum]|eukprot:XP_003288899.1 hypothetical protein DICPUDRAFT_98175 [Dictyostelium purpureum]
MENQNESFFFGEPDPDSSFFDSIGAGDELQVEQQPPPPPQEQEAPVEQSQPTEQPQESQLEQTPQNIDNILVSEHVVNKLSDSIIGDSSDTKSEAIVEQPIVESPIIESPQQDEQIVSDNNNNNNNGNESSSMAETSIVETSIVEPSVVEPSVVEPSVVETLPTQEEKPNESENKIENENVTLSQNNTEEVNSTVELNNNINNNNNNINNTELNSNIESDKKEISSFFSNTDDIDHNASFFNSASSESNSVNSIETGSLASAIAAEEKDASLFFNQETTNNNNNNNNINTDQIKKPVKDISSFFATPELGSQNDSDNLFHSFNISQPQPQPQTQQPQQQPQQPQPQPQPQLQSQSQPKPEKDISSFFGGTSSSSNNINNSFNSPAKPQQSEKDVSSFFGGSSSNGNTTFGNNNSSINRQQPEKDVSSFFGGSSTSEASFFGESSGLDDSSMFFENLNRQQEEQIKREQEEKQRREREERERREREEREKREREELQKKQQEQLLQQQQQQQQYQQNQYQQPYGGYNQYQQPMNQYQPQPINQYQSPQQPQPQNFWNQTPLPLPLNPFQNQYQPPQQPQPQPIQPQPQLQPIQPQPIQPQPPMNPFQNQYQSPQQPQPQPTQPPQNYWNQPPPQQTSQQIPFFNNSPSNSFNSNPNPSPSSNPGSFSNQPPQAQQPQIQQTPQIPLHSSSGSLQTRQHQRSDSSSDQFSSLLKQQVNINNQAPPLPMVPQINNPPAQQNLVTPPPMLSSPPLMMSNSNPSSLSQQRSSPSSSVTSQSMVPNQPAQQNSVTSPPLMMPISNPSSLSQQNSVTSPPLMMPISNPSSLSQQRSSPSSSVTLQSMVPNQPAQQNSVTSPPLMMPVSNPSSLSQQRSSPSSSVTSQPIMIPNSNPPMVPVSSQPMVPNINSPPIPNSLFQQTSISGSPHVNNNIGSPHRTSQPIGIPGNASPLDQSGGSVPFFNSSPANGSPSTYNNMNAHYHTPPASSNQFVRNHSLPDFSNRSASPNPSHGFVNYAYSPTPTPSHLQPPLNGNNAQFYHSRSTSWNEQPMANQYFNQNQPQRQVGPLFTRPHPVIAFGFGGKIAQIKLNSNPVSADGVNLSKYSIQITPIKSLISHNTFYNNVATFPGPLNSSSSKDAVGKWITERVNDIASGKIDTLCSKDLEASTILWELLKILLNNYGNLFNSVPSDKDEKTVAKSIQALLLDNKSVQTPFRYTPKNSKRTEADTSLLINRIQTLMNQGDIVAAQAFALENEVWSHALILAHQLGGEAYNRTLSTFAQASLPTGTPLKTLYSLYSGTTRDLFVDIHNSNQSQLPEQKQNSFAFLDSWKENIATLLFNGKANGCKVIGEIGDCIWQSQKRIEAAHICYLLADYQFGPLNNPSCRIVLLGGDHKIAKHFITTESLQRSEIYEYSKILGNSQYSLPILFVYKFVYATYLCDIGLIDLSLKYLNHIKNLLKNHQQQISNPCFIYQLDTFAERITSYSSNKKLSESGSWFQSIFNKGFKILGGSNKQIPTHGSSDQLLTSPNVAAPVVVTSTNTTPVKDQSNSGFFGKASTPVQPATAAQATATQSFKSHSKHDEDEDLYSSFSTKPKAQVAPQANDSNKNDLSNTSDNNTGTLSGNTSPVKDDQQEAKPGLLAGLFWKKKPKPKEMNLETTSDFYFNEELGKWVERGKEAEAMAASQPPPPPPTESFSPSTPDGMMTPPFGNSSPPSSSSPSASRHLPGAAAAGSDSLAPPGINKYSLVSPGGPNTRRKPRYVDTLNQTVYTGGSLNPTPSKPEPQNTNSNVFTPFMPTFDPSMNIDQNQQQPSNAQPMMPQPLTFDPSMNYDQQPSNAPPPMMPHAPPPMMPQQPPPQ